MTNELKNIYDTALFISTTCFADEQDYKNLKKRIVALNLDPRVEEKAIKELCEVLKV